MLTSGYPIETLIVNGRRFQFPASQNQPWDLSHVDVFFLNPTPIYMVSMHLEPMKFDDDDWSGKNPDLWLFGHEIGNNGEKVPRVRIRVDNVDWGTYDIGYDITNQQAYNVSDTRYSVATQVKGAGTCFSNPILYHRAQVPDIPLAEGYDLPTHRPAIEQEPDKYFYIHGSDNSDWGPDWIEYKRNLYHNPTREKVDLVNIRLHPDAPSEQEVSIDSNIDNHRTNYHSDHGFLRIHVFIPSHPNNQANYEKILYKMSNMRLHVSKAKHSDNVRRDVFDVLQYQSSNFRTLTGNSMYLKNQNIRF